MKRNMLHITTATPERRIGALRVNSELGDVSFYGPREDVLDQIIALQSALDDAATKVSLWPNADQVRDAAHDVDRVWPVDSLVVSEATRDDDEWELSL